jgi:hypothetical protein
MIVDPDRYIKTFADLGANIKRTLWSLRTMTLQAIKPKEWKLE